MSKKTNDTKVTEGSGNVFADLGFPSADREQLKAKLMLEIYRAIKDRGLTQTQAGRDSGHSAAACLSIDERSLRQLFSRPTVRVSERAWPRHRDYGAAQSAAVPSRTNEVVVQPERTGETVWVKGRVSCFVIRVS